MKTNLFSNMIFNEMFLNLQFFNIFNFNLKKGILIIEPDHRFYRVYRFNSNMVSITLHIS